MLFTRDRLTYGGRRGSAEVFPVAPGGALPDLGAEWGAIRKGFAHDPVRRAKAHYDFVERISDIGRRMHVPRVQAIHVAEEALRTVTRGWTAPHPSEVQSMEGWRARQTLELAQRYLHALALDDAARVLAGLAKTSTSSDVLADVEAMVRAVAQVKAFFAGPLPHPEWSREAFRESNLGPIGARNVGVALDSVLRSAERDFGGDDPVRAHWNLTKMRRWWGASGSCADRSWLLGSEPVWVLRECKRLHTGPRPDPWRTTQLLYAWAAPGERSTTSDRRDYDERKALPMLAMVGARPHRDVTVRTSLTWKAPEWFEPARFSSRHEAAPLPDARPAVALLVGARSVDAGPALAWQADPQAPERPMTAWAARVAGGRLEIVRLRETLEDGRGPVAFDGEVLAGEALRKPLGDGDRLELEVRGKTLTARAGRAKVREEGRVQT